MFPRPFKSFTLYYTIIYFLFASLNLLTNFEMLSETLLRIPFSVTDRWSQVPTSHWGKCGKIILSQAASGMILQNHRQLPVSIFSVKKSPL
jgi:hypothetical protein